MSEYNMAPSFDFGAATLQGFNLPGGRSYLVRVAVWAALLMTIIYVALGGSIVRAYIDVFQNMITTEFDVSGNGQDPKVLMAMMAPMIRATGVMMLIGLLQVIVFTSAETAIYRNLFHQEDRGVFPLTFGMDELRVLGTRFVVGLILGGIYIGVYLGVFLIGAMFAGAAGALESGFLGAIGGILILLMFIAAIAVFAWVAVRLAPASAYSVKDRVFSPLASWTPMKGRVWPAIGSFLIVYFVGYFVLGFVLSIVFVVLFLSSGIIGVMMDLDVTSDATPDFSAIGEHISSAGFIIPLIIAIFISMFLAMIWYGSIWSMWGYFAKDAKDPEYWEPEIKAEPELWKPS